MKIAFALSILAAGVLFAVENSGTDVKSKMKPLQQELIATLKEAVDVAEVAKSNGQMSALDALHAQRAYLDATLDDSETAREKIGILVKIVELQKTIEAMADASHKSARGNYVEFLKAKAARIKAEIAVEKEKSNLVK